MGVHVELYDGVSCYVREEDDDAGRRLLKKVFDTAWNRWLVSGILSSMCFLEPNTDSAHSVDSRTYPDSSSIALLSHAR